MEKISREEVYQCSKEILEKTASDLSDFCNATGISRKACNSILMCSDEIISNIVFYSGAETLTISSCFADGTVTISFTDNGKAFNPLEESKEPDIMASLDDRPIGGLGIFIVKKMMSSVSYERTSGKNVLTVSLVTGA